MQSLYYTSNFLNFLFTCITYICIVPHIIRSILEVFVFVFESCGPMVNNTGKRLHGYGKQRDPRRPCLHRITHRAGPYLDGKSPYGTTSIMAQ